MEGLLLIGWLVLSGVVAFIAAQRGRGGAVWFVTALLLSPVLAYAILVAIPVGAGVASAAGSSVPRTYQGDESPLLKRSSE